MSDSGTRVQVAVRVRPLLPQEKSDGCENCVQVLSDRELLLGGNKQFTFDHVFAAVTDQQIVFDRSVRALVENLFEGYNATVFAYGQTGSGKTFTMGSGCEVGLFGEDNDVGVIPRAVDHIFDTIAKKRREYPNDEFFLRIQFLELYGEILRDLLDPAGTAKGKRINLRDSDNNAVQVIGAFEESVRSREEMLGLLERGTLCRTTASTSMNTHSSRSHAIFTIILEQQLKAHQSIGAEYAVSSKNASPEGETEFRISKFHFVDLAGSERAKRTNSTGLRMKEGIDINKGLLALGNVISALSSNVQEATPKFINYRDSKLTRLLQDSLGGNSRTLMITCISPADVNLEETLNALRYASRARNIQNRAVINRDPSSSLVASLKAEVARLKNELALATSNSENASGLTAADASTGALPSLKSPSKQVAMLEEEISKLLQKLNEETMTRKVLEERLATLEAERRVFLGLGRDTLFKPQHRPHGSIVGRLRSASTSSFSSFDEEFPDEEAEVEEGTVSESRGRGALDAVPEGEESGEETEHETSTRDLRDRFEQSQKALRTLVMRYDETLHEKETAMTQMMEERTRFEALKQHFEQKMQEMNQEVKITQEQREQLQKRLQQLEQQNTQTESSRTAAMKIRAQVAEKDSRLKELEDRTRQLQEARRAAVEWQKRESQLRGEIQQMKRDRTELQRQMAENQKRHLEELAQRKLEIAGLQRERRRLEQDTQTLSARMARDAKVLQIKSEQVVAMQRKLREAQRSLMGSSLSKALSERENAQRLEIEQLAAIQVQREEELVALRRALAKKERAILRRNRLLEKLQRAREEQEKSSQFGYMNPVTIRELVPKEATLEDVVELEQRLEALDTEISFRDEQCRQAMLQEEVSATAGEDAGRPAAPVAAIWASVNTMDQARDLCRVLMQMFVESKRELRESRLQTQKLNGELAARDELTLIERLRFNSLLTAPVTAQIDEEPVQLQSQGLIDPGPEEGAKATGATRSQTEDLKEARLRTLEERLRQLRVNEEDHVKPPTTPPLPNTGSKSVFDRLANPAMYTGIHRFAAQPRAVAPGSMINEQQQVDPSLPQRKTRIPSIRVVLNDGPVESSSNNTEGVDSFANPTLGGWERVALRMTESYNSKRQLPLRDPMTATVRYPSKRPPPPPPSSSSLSMLGSSTSDQSNQIDSTSQGDQEPTSIARTSFPTSTPVHERLSDPRFFTGTHKHKFQQQQLQQQQQQQQMENTPVTPPSSQTRPPSKPQRSALEES